MVNSHSLRENLSGLFSDSGGNNWQSNGGCFGHTDKNNTLLETRMFNETPLNPLKCYDTLTKILHLLFVKGESLTPVEESNIFFSVTKLFQSNNDRLRRMFYLTIKALKMEQGEAFIVISSLTKDMNSGTDARRGNAIRVLSKIIDASMATQIDRFLKTAIIDKSPFVASASLVCALKLWRVCPDLIRRWVNEVTECVKSKSPSVQYHALTLLYEMKKNDRLALRKTISGFLSEPLQGYMANCLLIRYATESLQHEYNEEFEKAVITFLDKQLCSRSDLIVLEAAQALCSLVPKFPSLDLSSTLTALQILVASSRPVIRFAAIRVLNQLAQKHAQHVISCNPDIEVLLNDANKYIAILALTTLLKTSHENSVEKLVKKISALMSEVGDHFRLRIIKAVRQLALTYPSKHIVLLTFFADEIREEASFDVKKDLLDTISLLMQRSHQALELGLIYLCEYIEDCEYSLLCIKILTLLGDTAPKSSTPSKYIRFIYNRLILETPSVRAAAIHALANFAYQCPHVREDISILLQSCLLDRDDEIRERMHLYFKAIKCATNVDDKQTTTGTFLEQLIHPPVTVPIDALLSYAQKAVSNSKPLSISLITDFNLDSLAERNDETLNNETHSLNDSTRSNQVDDSENMEVAEHQQNEYKCIIEKLQPGIDSGLYSHATPRLFVTEREAEYSVQYIKHIFHSRYLLLEFLVTNTMSNQTLKNLKIIVNTGEASGWCICNETTEDMLCFEDTRSLYTLLRLDSPFTDLENSPVPIQHEVFSAVLYFDVIEPESEREYSDHYALENFSINIGDYFTPNVIKKEQFKEAWGALGPVKEFSANYLLNYQNLETAVTQLSELLRLTPLIDAADSKNDKTTQTLLSSGLFMRRNLFLLRCSLVFSEQHGCILKITCRTALKDLSVPFLNLLQSLV